MRAAADMSPYEKAILFLIRSLALGLVLTSLVLYGSYFFYMVAGKKAEETIQAKILKGVPLITGVILLIKGGSIARKIAEKIEG